MSMQRILLPVICVLFLTAGRIAAQTEPAKEEPGKAAGAPPAAAPTKEEEALQKLTVEKNTLAAQNSLREEKLKEKLSKLTTEKQELEAEYALLQQRLKNKLAELESEKAGLELENALQVARLQKETAAAKARNDAIDLEIASAQKALQKELLTLSAEKERLAAANLLNVEKYNKTLAEMKHENEKLALENEKLQQLQAKQKMEIDFETAQLNFEAIKLKNEQAKYEADLTKLQADLSLREEKDKWKAEVNREIEYTKQPFEKGVLTISDRRIQLNGPIMSGTADYVTKRIDYFNNKSHELPIFIVIDSSPGGSVMEGYRIIKAMQASKAPIHVIVKSFAASMAAVIATMGKYSYAYPNAIILHHQPSSVSWGNLTVQKEQLEIFKEWARRLHEPVARKMNVTMDDFYKKMYEKNSEGDWQEFADVAAKLKWVDHIVDEIREEGQVKQPADEVPETRIFFIEEGEKEHTASYVRLPRPEPFDFYFIYNPDSHYRWEQ